MKRLQSVQNQMWPVCGLQGLVPVFAVVILLVLLVSSSAKATQEDMDRLPLINPYLCLTCHFSSDPNGGETSLNPFGTDFEINGRVWDYHLANLNSDGDGCLNGVEIGDSDGDGVVDGNVTEQAGNPGVQDNCGSGSLVDEKTWDALKAMFDGH